MSSCSKPSVVLLALSSALLAAGGTQAATVNRYDYQSAAGVCQGALPAFAGTLRARPLAIGNEGASPAFVSCAMQGDDESNTRTTHRNFLRVGNTGTGALTINCTYVYGFGAGPAPTFLTRTVNLAAGASALVNVLPADLGVTDIEYGAQWSCSLPPGAVVYYSGRLYSEDIGG